MCYSVIYLEISFWEAIRVDLGQFKVFQDELDIFVSLQVVLKLRDLSQSIRLVELYNIARNQLLGCSERRF